MTSWFLSVPAEHEASFLDEVRDCDGTVRVVHRFSGDDGGTVHLDVHGGSAVDAVIGSFRYLALMGL